MLALFFASPSIALRPTFAPNPCPRHVPPSAFEEFAESVWRLPSWERGPPKAKTIAAAHHQIYCARGTGRRGALKHRWREAQRAFYTHRRAELRLRARLRYLPYSCGGGTRSAIPCSIMWCESGGSYSARNPSSSARGKYQMLDTTYVEWCVACDWSRQDQDRAAHDLYAVAGGSPWACA